MPDDRRQRLLRASATRASIEHPNLVPARLVRDNSERRVRLVLLECSAPRLDEVLSSGPLSGKECLKVVYGAASAADALARHGLVAIDLRPSRVLVDPKRGGILADQASLPG
jgi:serine/threonine protein kinase